MTTAAAHFDWTEKHRPRTLSEIVGNRAAVEALAAWAKSWETGKPEKPAVILAGPPGVGKTTAALALARDFGWGVVELNASDQRNEEAIRRVATSGAVHRAFTASGEFRAEAGGRQLVLLDEADNLFGQEDRGGMRAILDTIKVAKQPIILIANDYYELTRRGAALRTAALTIKFTKVHSASIPPALRRIAKEEGLELEPGVDKALADRAGGDLRSAVNDLQALAAGRARIAVADVEALGKRDEVGDVWGLLGAVFYGRNVDEARKAAWGLDETPDAISLWLDENLPVFYTEPADLVEGYRWLSRADQLLGRVRRRQQYGLWSYATEIMTGGVAIAKSGRPSGARFQFPSWLRKQSASRGIREIRARAARKIGDETHTSRSVALSDHLPYIRALYEADPEFAVWATWRFDFEADELAFVLGEKDASARVKKLIDAASSRGPAPVRQPEAFSDFDEGDADDGGDDGKPRPSAKDDDEDEDADEEYADGKEKKLPSKPATPVAGAKGSAKAAQAPAPPAAGAGNAGEKRAAKGTKKTRAKDAAEEAGTAPDEAPPPEKGDGSAGKRQRNLLDF